MSMKSTTRLGVFVPIARMNSLISICHKVYRLRRRNITKNQANGVRLSLGHALSQAVPRLLVLGV